MPVAPAPFLSGLPPLKDVLQALPLGLDFSFPSLQDLGSSQPRSRPQAEGARQEPHANGWLRVGASVGIFPVAGRLKYSFVYHGELLDSHEGATEPRPKLRPAGSGAMAGGNQRIA